MNWKSGLTRLYVVAWTVWAIGTGYMAGNETYLTVRAVKLASEYRPEPDVDTSVPMEDVPAALADSSSLFTYDYKGARDEGWAAPEIAAFALPWLVSNEAWGKQRLDQRIPDLPRVVFGPDSLMFVFRSTATDSAVAAALRNYYRDAEAKEEHKRAVLEAVTDPRRLHSSRRILSALGLWLLAGLAIPGALLAAARWTLGGFAAAPKSGG